MEKPVNGNIDIILKQLKLIASTTRSQQMKTACALAHTALEAIIRIWKAETAGAAEVKAKYEVLTEEHAILQQQFDEQRRKYDTETAAIRLELAAALNRMPKLQGLVIVAPDKTEHRMVWDTTQAKWAFNDSEHCKPLMSLTPAQVKAEIAQYNHYWL
jgi:hypothetical protein